jgi:hypothetical protein
MEGHAENTLQRLQSRKPLQPLIVDKRFVKNLAGPADERIESLILDLLGNYIVLLGRVDRSTCSPTLLQTTSRRVCLT